MEDQLAIKEKLKKNQMDKTKLVSHFEGGGGGGGGGGAGAGAGGRGVAGQTVKRERKREKKRERRGRRRKRRAKGMDFYGFLWISLDTCIDFYGFV